MPLSFLSDLSNLPPLPWQSLAALVGVGLIAFGYGCGVWDRKPQRYIPDTIDWKPERSRLSEEDRCRLKSAMGKMDAASAGIITPLTEDEKKADAVLCKTIPGYAPETVAAMNAIGKKLKGGAGRNSKGQFLPRESK